MSLLDKVRIINFPKILDQRGNLSFMESENQIPFSIKRTYWIYDVPGGEIRGGHSYIKNKEIIVALSGSFNVILSDGEQTKTISLNRSYYGLYVPNGIWRHMENFSTNSLAFILASTNYDESDYIREISEYSRIKNGISV